MLTRLGRAIRQRSGGEFFLIFGLTILLPGVLLAVLGVRALLQERRLATEQMRERLDLAAESAASDLVREVRGWQFDIDQFARGDLDRADPKTVPARIGALA